MKTVRFFLLITIGCFPMCGSSASPETGATNASVTEEILMLKSNGNIKELSPMAFGVNTQCLRGPSWRDNRFLEKIRDMHLNHMRYPGGTIGNFFDWRTGRPLSVNRRNTEPIPIPEKMQYRIKDVNTYTLDDLKRALEMSPGTEATFMVNMLTDNLENALDMLRTAQKKGIPFHYVELGNEFYLTYYRGGDWKSNTPGYYTYPECYPSAQSYAEECRKWIKAIKAEFPDVKLAFVGCNFDGNNAPWITNSTRAVNWNRDMMAAGLDVDGVIIHIYTNNRGTNHPAESFLRTKRRLDENRLHFDRTFGKLPVWLTEYNIKSDQNKYVGQWIMALHSIFMPMEVLLIPQVEICDFHNLTAEYQIALIYANSQKIPVELGSEKTVEVKPLELSASGYGFRFLGEALKNAGAIESLTIEGSPVFSSKEGTTPLVWGYRIETRDGDSRLLLLNLADKPVMVNGALNGRSPQSGRTGYAATLTEVITSASQVTLEKLDVTTGGIITLPACSMNLLEY